MQAQSCRHIGLCGKGAENRLKGLINFIAIITAVGSAAFAAAEIHTAGTVTGRTIGIAMAALLLWLIYELTPEKKEKAAPKAQQICIELKGSGWKEVTHDDR